MQSRDCGYGGGQQFPLAAVALYAAENYPSSESFLEQCLRPKVQATCFVEEDRAGFHVRVNLHVPLDFASLSSKRSLVSY